MTAQLAEQRLALLYGGLFLLAAVLTALLLCKKVTLHHTIKKQLTSAVFVAAALVSTVFTGGATYAVLLLAGAVCGWVGDLVIDFEGTPCFLGGMAAFFAGHVFYAAAFMYGSRAFLGKPLLTWTELLALAALLLLFVAASVLLKCKFGGIGIPVLAYAAVIALMAVKAGFLTVGLFSENKRVLVLAVGAVLFVVSDAVLALERFCDKASDNMGVLNLITYYSGQMLLALSPVVLCGVLV